ncbi:MAG: DNA-binding Lrp family transcriptional regulator [Halieaceae bacterium]
MNNAERGERLEMDDIDSRIIALLRRDGRMPYRTMAQDLGLTETTIRARVRRLEDSNLMKVVAVTDFEALGYGMMLAIGIEVENRSPAEVAEDLALIPEVFSITVVVGTHDIQTLVVTRDLDSLGELISHRLADLPGVRRVIPSLAVNVLKNQPAWIPFHNGGADPS